MTHQNTLDDALVRECTREAYKQGAAAGTRAGTKDGERAGLMRASRYVHDQMRATPRWRARRRRLLRELADTLADMALSIERPK